MSTTKTTENGRKKALKAPAATKCIDFSITVQQTLSSFVKVPADITEEELADLVHEIVENGPYEREDYSWVVLDFEAEHVMDATSCEDEFERSNGQLAYVCTPKRRKK